MNIFIKNNKYGFTLIELLVVVAVIGILSSIVLASLNSARDKAHASAIKSELSSMRAEAEIYWNENGRSYNNVCTSTTDNGDAEQLYNSAKNKGDGGDCFDNADSWAAHVDIDGSSTFCVDYTGVATSSLTADNSGSDKVCN